MLNITVKCFYFYMYFSSFTRFPHRFSNNTVTDSGLIIYKPCQVRFYCITPLDLKKCSYIVIIFKGIYAYPLPSPVKIPINFG